MNPQNAGAKSMPNVFMALPSCTHFSGPPKSFPYPWAMNMSPVPTRKSKRPSSRYLSSDLRIMVETFPSHL